VNLNGSDVNPDPVGRELAASCVINDNGTDKLLSIGGFNSSGTGLAEVFAYTPGSPGTWTKVATLANARGLAKAIQVPGDTHSCIVLGGLTAKSSGSDVSTAEKITVSAGPTWTVANAGSFTGYDFGLVRCGSNDVIAFGGRNAAGTLSTQILRYHGTTSTTAWPALKNANASPATVTLKTGRASFAYAVHDAPTTFTRIVVAAGQTAATNYSKTIEGFEVENVTPVGESQTCRLKSTTATVPVDLSDSDNMGANELVVGRFGAVMFPTSASVMKIVSGDTSTALDGTVEDFTINWSTPAITSGPTQTTPSNFTAVRYPALVNLGSAFDWMLVGGEGHTTLLANNHAGTAISKTGAIQKFSSAWSFADLTIARTGNIAEYIGSTVYTGQGRDASNNFLTSTESIAP
jgi:hypothetical protein